MPKHRGQKPAELAPSHTDSRLLTRREFQTLATVPPEAEWFADITNAHTRRAYRTDVGDFSRFVGLAAPEKFRNVARAHIIAWRKNLERRSLSPTTIRRKLAALSSLFGHLCERNAVATNPVDGVRRPGEGSNEGKTPALGDHQAKRLLDAPPSTTPKGKPDRAILSVFLFHGLRREELCKLRVRDVAERRGVPHLRVHGKGSKIRFVPLHPGTLDRINDYLERAGHREHKDAFLFQPVSNPSRNGSRMLNPTSIYRNVVAHWAKAAGISIEGLSPHALRATAATNALDHDADIAKVQEWLGHSSISTTRLYDRRASKPEDSPTFRVSY